MSELYRVATIVTDIALVARHETPGGRISLGGAGLAGLIRGQADIEATSEAVRQRLELQRLSQLLDLVPLK